MSSSYTSRNFFQVSLEDASQVSIDVVAEESHDEEDEMRIYPTRWTPAGPPRDYEAPTWRRMRY